MRLRSSAASSTVFASSSTNSGTPPAFLRMVCATEAGKARSRRTAPEAGAGCGVKRFERDRPRTALNSPGRREFGPVRDQQEHRHPRHTVDEHRQEIAFLIPLGFAVVGTSLNLSILFSSTAPTPVFDDLLGLHIPIDVTPRISVPVTVATLFFLIVGHPIHDYLSTRSLKSAVRGLGAGLLEAVVKPFEFFINTISYIRLGVLLITTTLLGSLVAGVMSQGIVGIVVAAFLNIAVISLEGVIVYIQDMRLQFYEWFSQFYVGAGTPFVPLESRGDHFTVSWV